MEKKTFYIIITTLIIGLSLGYLIFGGSAQNAHKHEATLTEEGVIWTCAMHPQIRQDSPGICPICGMDLTKADVDSDTNPLVFRMSHDAVKLSNIQTSIVGGGLDLNSQFKVSGKIQVNETEAASLVAHIPGRIKKLYISFTGEKVSMGQKIAQIYSPDLITAQNELLEANKMSGTNPSLLKAAKNKMKYWKITDEQIGSILSSGNVQEHFIIYADYSGVVKNRKVSVGDYISKGEVLFDIQNLNKLWALFDVYESDLTKIEVGNKITFKTPSLPDEEFVATVSFIDPIINSSTRAASVRVELNNSANKLKPEMFVNGTITGISATKNENILVPKTAVLWTGERSVVYVKVPDMDVPSFEFREVTLGESTGKNYLVLNGLTNGEEVVTNGAFVIDASAQLNNRTSMMNRNIAGQSNSKSEKLPDYTSTTPDLFKKQLQTTVDAYIVLKDDLVNSNSTQAKKSATLLKAKLKNTDMGLLKESEHMFWMEKMNAMNAHIDLILAKNNLEEMRIQFDFLSQLVIKSIKVYGVHDGTYYEQYCSMAFYDKGASWISLQKDIRNPYFGDKMLKCGDLKETITVH